MVAIDMLRFIQNPADLAPKEKPKQDVPPVNDGLGDVDTSDIPF
jgi:hypothetical protein